MTANELTG